MDLHAIENPSRKLEALVEVVFLAFFACFARLLVGFGGGRLWFEIVGFFYERRFLGRNQGLLWDPFIVPDSQAIVIDQFQCTKSTLIILDLGSELIFWVGARHTYLPI